MTLALAQPQLEAITAACRKHHVARFHAFGSVLRPDYRPGESDIDLLGEFLPLDASKLYRAYFALLNDLRQGLASRDDVVMEDAVRNPIGRQAIDPSKQQIYAGCPLSWRLIRSAVEREFITIGEALMVIAVRDPQLFAAIPEGRQIIDFRNLLTHEYLNVSNHVLWGAIQVNLPVLVEHCRQLLEQLQNGNS